jgi:hypothetical protein
MRAAAAHQRTHAAPLRYGLAALLTLSGLGQRATGLASKRLKWAARKLVPATSIPPVIADSIEIPPGQTVDGAFMLATDVNAAAEALDNLKHLLRRQSPDPVQVVITGPFLRAASLRARCERRPPCSS